MSVSRSARRVESRESRRSFPGVKSHSFFPLALATGEEFPDAVLFNAHPNGHLYGGSPDKETDVLCVPICGCIKVRARAPAGHAARRPAAPPDAPRPAAARRS